MNMNVLLMFLSKFLPCNKKGQAMVEYVIMAGIFILSVVVLSVFLYSFREHSDRVLNLAAYDYP